MAVTTESARVADTTGAPVPEWVALHARIGEIVAGWEADHPDHDTLPRAERRAARRALTRLVNSETRQFHLGMSVQRQAARAHFSAAVRQFQDAARSYTVDEAQRRHLDATVNGAENPPPTPLQVELPASLRAERDALTAAISDNAYLSDQDKARARIAVQYHRADLPVFRADRQLELDVLEYYLRQITDSLARAWTQARDTATQISARIAARRGPRQSRPAVAETGSGTGGVLDRPTQLADWLEDLRARLTDPDSGFTISAILTEYAAVTATLDTRLADRALILATQIAKDIHEGTVSVADPRTLLLDGDAFDAWDTARQPATRSADIEPSAEQVDADAAAMAAPLAEHRARRGRAVPDPDCVGVALDGVAVQAAAV